jgi:superfamily II DNA/RNA helicase
MSFDQLGLSDKVQAAVATSGYTTPTPVQEQAIPHVLQRRDVLGIAQTGTGKTAAFTLPMLTLLEKGRARARMPRTLILEPTRELAAQVEESFVKYGKNHKLSMALLIGGVSFDDQDAKLTRGVDVLIATPGRLLDHFERGRLLLSGIEVLVIDEADRMLDMGFIPDIERICKLTPFTRQTLFFSATMPPEIQRLVGQFLTNPVKIEVSRPASTVDAVTQILVSSASDPAKKREILRALIRAETSIKNGIIFCNRKTEVAKLHRSLVRHGFSAIALHGDMDQRSRTNALESFRKGEITLLIASDVAARGLDIPDVSHVFNFDVPHHAEDYVHRIGRTGRAGRAGASFTIASSADSKSVAAIEKLIGRKIEWKDAPAQAASDAPDAPRTERNERGRSARGNRRGERPSRSEKPQQQPQQQAQAPRDPVPPQPRERQEQRRPQAEPAGDSVASHLPAFLLRPVPVKAG